MGFTYRQMEQADDCHLPVVDLRCRYKSPAHYDDEIVIRTAFKNIRESLVHFHYEISRATDGALLAEGETTHLVTVANMNKRSLPERYFAAFKQAVKPGR